jgi:PPOX class probable F420-dependent enzyme
MRTIFLSLLLDVGVLFTALASQSGIATAAATARDISTLANSTYVYVATVRKDGNQSKAVPVWFVTNEQNQILIDSNTGSWKVRRVRRGSPVLVWMGSQSGPAFIGTAELVTDKKTQEAMIEKIPQKYRLAWLGLFGPKQAKFDSGEIVTIRITPARDLPAGFEPQPGTPAPTLGDKPVSPGSQ